MLYFFLIKIFQGQSTDTHTEEKKKKVGKDQGIFGIPGKFSHALAHTIFMFIIKNLNICLLYFYLDIRVSKLNFKFGYYKCFKILIELNL